MKCYHVSHPSIHTDRPRCYALMREDYLWSPLQSACSMQHLRSVPSLGRQVWPSTLTHTPLSPTLHLSTFPPPALCAISYHAGTLSGVLVFYCHLVPQALIHIMQISHEVTPPHSAAWCAHNVH